MEEVVFIREIMKQKEYMVLPETIAIGTVYKIHYFGDLERNGFEIGYLYIPKGSGIKLHKHVADIERYKKIIGELVVNGEKCDINICLIGKSHGLAPVSQDTIVSTCKVTKKYLMETDILFDDDFFDNLIKKELTSIEEQHSEYTSDKKKIKK